MHLVSLFSSFISLVSRDRETFGSVMHSGTFPVVELLELDYYHLKAMAAGGMLNRHPNTLTHLKILKLHLICLGKVDEISMACPAETVALDPVPEPLEVQGWSVISLNQLREVEIHRVSGTRLELNFVKVILAKSPILERLIIKLESNEVSEELRILKELIGFKRLSPEADAVRTSVLSKQWRYIWTTIPQLVFDDMFYKGSYKAMSNNLVMTIYQVLLQHRGPILKFTVSLMALESCPQIDQLIHFVSKNGIQELTLYLFNGGLYKLPSSLFSCGGITCLDLFSCVFKPPPRFKGFGKLLCLKLDKVFIAGDTLSSLISTCPLLERLTIQRTFFKYLEIVALNLRFVRLSLIYSSICFKNTPHLAKVSLMHLVSPFSSLVSRDQETFGSVMHSGTFPVVERLKFDYYHLKAMAAGGILNRHPNTLTHLKILKLHLICLGKVDEISMACPGETVALDPVPEPLEVQGWSDISLNQLREVEIHRVSGTRLELNFVKVILAKSPILERLIIKLESNEVSEELRILKELIGFKRLSPEAIPRSIFFFWLLCSWLDVCFPLVLENLDPFGTMALVYTSLSSQSAVFPRKE
ncbi:hypothetical protein RHGRI_033739 [Rhododendron griersonianum]|uniref:FBD domain-containing protein n=1 Tax=Rhododendron griersonianum TaxID=479676 RepID=A0AAV6I3H3_9ERIC|nr:hypothetical protein RHGRI_033739 [Rhododendron griersonianum]